LKNTWLPDHSLYHSRTNFVINPIAELMAYASGEEEPSLSARVKELGRASSALIDQSHAVERSVLSLGTVCLG
jgi:hypothetical protein